MIPSDLTCQALRSLRFKAQRQQAAADHQSRQLQAAGWSAAALSVRGVPWMEVLVAPPMPAVWTAEWDVSPTDCDGHRRRLPVVRWAYRHVLFDACPAPSFAERLQIDDALKAAANGADGVFNASILPAMPRSMPSMIHWLHHGMGIPYRRIYRWPLRHIKAQYRKHAQTYRAWVDWEAIVAIDPVNRHLHYRGNFPLAVNALTLYVQGDTETMERHREH